MNTITQLAGNETFWWGAIFGLCVGLSCALLMVAMVSVRLDRRLLIYAQSHIGIQLGERFYFIVGADQYVECIKCHQILEDANRVYSSECL